MAPKLCSAHIWCFENKKSGHEGEKLPQNCESEMPAFHIWLSVKRSTARWVFITRLEAPLYTYTLTCSFSPPAYFSSARAARWGEALIGPGGDWQAKALTTRLSQSSSLFPSLAVSVFLRLGILSREKHPGKKDLHSTSSKRRKGTEGPYSTFLISANGLLWPSIRFHGQNKPFI